MYKKTEQKTDEKMRIIVADDEDQIVDILKTSLEFSGYEVDTFSTGTQAKEAILDPDNHYDAAILDVMMPELDGFSVVKEIRKSGSEIPILFLTAKDDINDELFGLTIGANDYIKKPFSIEMVLTRLKVLLRAIPGEKLLILDDPILQCKDITINQENLDVIVSGKRVDLTATELKLLMLLMKRADTVISKDEILSEIWGYNFVTDATMVETYMSYLRAKIGKKQIETKRGIGYIMRSK
ncbi:MAG: response regulator transcription factor [Bifidobacteriaceae bacterium]|jgi:two-component system OmpR family response regulator|nr:response regulator transcription factor [Bifidobacteriaceae bacterium]